MLCLRVKPLQVHSCKLNVMSCHSSPCFNLTDTEVFIFVLFRLHAVGFRQLWSVPAQIAVTVGGWPAGWGGRMWEWLVRVAPTPQELQQQTECTRRSARDKRSEIAIVAAAAAAATAAGSFLVWPVAASSGCRSGTDVMVLDSFLLYKEPECNAT